MEAELSLDIRKPEIAKKSIVPDETNSGGISTELEVQEDELKVRIRADGLANLRAAINTIFRLARVSNSATGI